MTLADALAALEGHADLSPCRDLWRTPAEILAQLGPEFRAAPVLLTPDHLAYAGADGRPVAGWAIRWCVDNPVSAP